MATSTRSLTKEDIDKFDYDAHGDFAEAVLNKRSKVSDGDLEMVKHLEHAADGKCFGAPRRCDSDVHGEVLEVELFGNGLDVRGIQDFVEARGDILLGGMFMIDDGWKPARLIVIVVDVKDNKLWA